MTNAETRLSRAIALTRIAALAAEAYRPETHGPLGDDLVALFVSYGASIGVTEEEARDTLWGPSLGYFIETRDREYE